MPVHSGAQQCHFMLFLLLIQNLWFKGHNKRDTTSITLYFNDTKIEYFKLDDSCPSLKRKEKENLISLAVVPTKTTPTRTLRSSSFRKNQDHVHRTHLAMHFTTHFIQCQTVACLKTLGLEWLYWKKVEQGGYRLLWKDPSTQQRDLCQYCQMETVAGVTFQGQVNAALNNNIPALFWWGFSAGLGAMCTSFPTINK